MPAVVKIVDNIVSFFLQVNKTLASAGSAVQTLLFHKLTSTNGDTNSK